ncbi:MAG: redox-regulated ATPase YchF [Spirochaetes bacterium GWB1_48_6]|nr:MAG: GTP-binding protein YchF [Parcubacteria group bacterium GW2011_GWF1_45_5]OHD13928.1 MAG: redox-regulated ATPase YchF [Spirochaetes bacterium GWB1_48_6]
MNLSVGIVGLPNVGKSTLFNALLKEQQAYVANFPFATIEPNIGVVPVPDSRLVKLSQLIKESENLLVDPPIVPATVQFVDIAGLIAGAHKGEGLGNKFLSHIRQVHAICHVVRAFQDSDIVREGSTNPQKDFSVVEMELILADLQTLEKQRDPGNTPDKELCKRWDVVQKFHKALSQGVPARSVEMLFGEQPHADDLHLLTSKPILIALNVGETDMVRADELEKEYAKLFAVSSDQVIAICAKTEMEIAGLSESEQQEYLQGIGVTKSGLERIIAKAFATLGLSTFLTAGEKEVRAWTIEKSMTAPQAAGVIHTDFEQQFIRMDVIPWDKLIEAGGWVLARQKGLIRSEGKEYVLRNGDVVIVKHGA